MVNAYLAVVTEHWYVEWLNELQLYHPPVRVKCNSLEEAKKLYNSYKELFYKLGLVEVETQDSFRTHSWESCSIHCTTHIERL